MKQCLADVNILLALLVVHHNHHNFAVRWFGDVAPRQITLCRVVQLALIRLMGNRAIMGEYVISASAAWQVVEDLLKDERVEFVAEPMQIDSVFPVMLRYSTPTHKLVADAWLAAFAIASSSRLVTLDSGFRQFKDLDLHLLNP